MTQELQASSLSSLRSFNQDGTRVAFQSGQFLQTEKPIKLNKNAFIGIGIMQMIIGVICFALNINLLLKVSEKTSGFRVVGYGIWGGIFFFISGLLALLTGSKRTSKCLIVSTMVVNVFSACIFVPVLIFGVIDFARYVSNGHFKNDKEFRTEIYSTIAVLAIIEGIISTICSALCCNANCCCSAADNVVVISGNPGNLSNSNDFGYQALTPPSQLSQPSLFPKQPPALQQPPATQQPPVPQQVLSSKKNELQIKIPSLYEDVDAY